MYEVKKRAAEDFSKARTKEIIHSMMHFLDSSKNRMLSFSEVKEILKPKQETYWGMKTVPVSLIVGSEGRYNDFNKYFLPKSDYLRPRWERVDQALLSDIILPPIQLYEMGGVYFVRDGNHRVSVAKSQGIEHIDAEVTSLSTEINISPSMTESELKAALLDYEKKLFYEKTNFGGLTGCRNLDFSIPGQYDTIYEHIMVHKYYLNMGIEGEIPFDSALCSWYEFVYRPVAEIITKENLCFLFPGRTPSDLYVWIVKHWDLLKKKYGTPYSLLDAARDYGKKYGRSKQGFSGLIQSGVNDILEKVHHCFFKR